MKENLVINPEITDNNEETLETTLRPQMLDEYIGQTKVKESMKVYIEAAKRRVSRPCFVIWPSRTW